MKKHSIIALVLISSLLGACTSVDIPSTGANEQKSNTVAGMGESIQDETWKITLNSAKIYDQIGDEYFANKPDEGKQFLVAFLEVENISSEDDYFNYLSIESYIDGYSDSINMLLTDVDGVGALVGDVAAGKKLKGYLAYQVSPEWKEVEFSYKGDFLSNDKLTFVITPEDIIE